MKTALLIVGIVVVIFVIYKLWPNPAKAGAAISQNINTSAATQGRG